MKTWLITGVSSGFGRAIADAALAAGDRVVGTLRHEEQRAAFSALMPGRSFGVLLDVTDFDHIDDAVAHIEQRVGPVDILVNNAGYGHEGLIEESSLDDLRRQFDVNVFGAVAMMKAVLPYMRARRGGHIINVTSMGGIITMAGLGFYHGSKFALEGISEALGKEVAHLGIHVTAVEPGAFRTDWAGRSMVRAPREIDDYDAVMNPIRQSRLGYSGKQPGNPDALGAAMIALVNSDHPPAHLLMGRDASRLVSEKLSALQTEFALWKDLTLSTDFADGQ